MTRPENTLEYGRTVGEAATQKTANLPLYRSVLQEPTVSLAGNSNVPLRRAVHDRDAA